MPAPLQFQRARLAPPPLPPPSHPVPVPVPVPVPNRSNPRREVEGRVIPLLLDEVGAATYSGIGRFKLRALRRGRRGPVLVLVGRSVRYRPEDLDAYVQANRVEPSDLPPVEHRAARTATGG